MYVIEYVGGDEELEALKGRGYQRKCYHIRMQKVHQTLSTYI